MANPNNKPTPPTPPAPPSGGEEPKQQPNEVTPAAAPAPAPVNPLEGKVKAAPAGGYTYSDINQDMAVIARNRPAFSPSFTHDSEVEFQWKLFKNKDHFERNLHWMAVTKENHADWFEPDAFDPDTGFIVQGILNNGKPEKIYMVRAKAAKQAEIAAMKQAQDQRRGGLKGKSLKDLEAMAAAQNKGKDRPQMEVIETPEAGRRGSWGELVGAPGPN